ncbi:MAG: hypothetical protein HQ582_34670 [Planctomycetes bacterium]|nr:hypothetical protein [Planctomycetota bacterium]
MKCFAHLLVMALAATATVGCGNQDQPKSADRPPPQSEPADTTNAADEKASLGVLKKLDANVALDEEGRAKVVRLVGPAVTDAELKHVAALTNLRGLHLDGTKVTDAGMVHLKPLTKLETLYCVSLRSARVREELKANTEIECIEAPLDDVLDNLGLMHATSFKINEEALEAAGIPPDTPITAKHTNIPLREALNAVLEPLELESTLGDATLIVTTKEAFAEERPNLTELRQVVPSLKDVLVDW